VAAAARLKGAGRRLTLARVRLHHYSFASTWEVDASPRDAYDVLHDIGDYPAWWPEVKEVWRRSDDEVDVRCRSLLPYDLRFTMRRRREDAESLVLEVALSGDLEGYTRWIVSPSGEGSRLSFTEEVVTNKKVLNRLALVARPAFRFNHTLMMRHGQAGLTTYLAGYRRAQEVEVERGRGRA
jgi:hypothetical protein